MKIMMKELDTENLILKRMSINDVFPLYEMRSDETQNHFLDLTLDQTIDQTMKYIEAMNIGIEDSKWMIWSARHKTTHEYVGMISLWKFDFEMKECEVGYGIHPKMKLQGFGLEMLNEVLRYSFQDLHMSRIHAYTEVSNIPSRKLLVKAGFIEKEILDEIGFHRKRIFHMVHYLISK